MQLPGRNTKKNLKLQHETIFETLDHHHGSEYHPHQTVFALVLVAVGIVGGDEEMGGVNTSSQSNASKIAAFGE